MIDQGHKDGKILVAGTLEAVAEHPTSGLCKSPSRGWSGSTRGLGGLRVVLGSLVRKREWLGW